MTHSKFYSSLLLLILVNAIIKPLWIFGIDRQVQIITGPVEYGTYFSLLNLSIVLGFLLDWGLTSFINRELASNKNALQHQLSSILFLKLLFALVYAVIVIIIAFLTGVQRWDIVGGVISIQFLTYLFVFFRSVVTANQWFKTDAWLSILDKTLMIILCGVFIFGPRLFGTIDIHKYLIAQIICTALAVIITIIILLNRGIVFKSPAFKFFDRQLFFSVLPFALTVFLMSAHFRLDGFLLERLHPAGAYEAGIYAGAYRLLDASNMIGYLIASFLLPFAARLWSEKKNIQEVVLQGRHLLLMFSIAVVSIGISLGPWLQQLLYHNNDIYAANVLSWTLAALIGYSLVQVYGTIMTATGNIMLFCKLNLIAVTINLILNFFLIPRYGALGCSIAALSTQTLLGIATMVYVHSRVSKDIEWHSIFIYLVTGLFLYGAINLLQQQSIKSWMILPAVALITFIIMWASKLISVNTWLNFIKKQ